MTIHVDSSAWRLQTNGGTPYRLKSRSGEFTAEEASAQEVLIIKATDLFDFVNESLPAPLELPDYILYPTPRLMPGTPLGTRRIAWKSHVEGKPVDPFGTDTTAPSGTYEGDLELTIDYGTQPLNDNENGSDTDEPLTFLEVTANASGEFLNVPVRGNAIWVKKDATEQDENVKEINIPQTVPVSQVEWNVKWSRIPYNFFNSYLAAILRQKLGTVNSSIIPMFYNAPVETILFVGWSLSQQFTWRSGKSGQPPVQLDLKFLEKNFLSSENVQVTHNHYYRPGKGFRKLLFNGTNPTYLSSNLINIFAP